MGEELLEFRVELGGERLVVRHDQRRLADWAMTLAIVNVLPEPVTPRSVWCLPGVEAGRASRSPGAGRRRAGTADELKRDMGCLASLHEESRIGTAVIIYTCFNPCQSEAGAGSWNLIRPRKPVFADGMSGGETYTHRVQ